MLRHLFAWKRLSMSDAVAYAHDRSDARIVFHTRAGAYNDESLIEFLAALHDELAGAKVTLIWDGLPSHRSRKMHAYIRAQGRWLAGGIDVVGMQPDSLKQSPSAPSWASRRACLYPSTAGSQCRPR
jgi:hypothetical protein